MIKTPSHLQDLSQRIYGKGKTEGVGACGVVFRHIGKDESIPDWIGPINLVAKRAGERSAGNLRAPFEVAGAGNGTSKWVTAPVLDPSRNRYRPVRRDGERLLVVLDSGLCSSLYSIHDVSK
jgi:hypothetical protein